jgi:hypothetical protein
MNDDLNKYRVRRAWIMIGQADDAPLGNQEVTIEETSHKSPVLQKPV